MANKPVNEKWFTSALSGRVILNLETTENQLAEQGIPNKALTPLAYLCRLYKGAKQNPDRAVPLSLRKQENKLLIQLSKIYEKTGESEGIEFCNKRMLDIIGDLEGHPDCYTLDSLTRTYVFSRRRSNKRGPAPNSFRCENILFVMSKTLAEVGLKFKNDAEMARFIRRLLIATGCVKEHLDGISEQNKGYSVQSVIKKADRPEKILDRHHS